MNEKSIFIELQQTMERELGKSFDEFSIAEKAKLADLVWEKKEQNNTCEQCNGTGNGDPNAVDLSDMFPCPNCLGTGKL